jgi:tetrahydromethanopterin S-methyltransferase subunit G
LHEFRLLDRRVSELYTWRREVEARVTANEERYKELSEKMDAIESKVDRLLGAVEGVGARAGTIGGGVAGVLYLLEQVIRLITHGGG